MIAKAARAGYVDGRSTASMFAWIRPNEGIWLPAINNYLLGNDPPAFDLLFWADDATNVTAALQRDMIEITLGNGFAHPNQVRALERPIDLAKVRVDAYLLAGLTDHIAPWPGCYRSATLLGAKSRFVVADAGHAAVIVAPPEARRGRYRTNRARQPTPSRGWRRRRSTREAGGTTGTAGSTVGPVDAVPRQPRSVMPITHRSTRSRHLRPTQDPLIVSAGGDSGFASVRCSTRADRQLIR